MNYINTYVNLSYSVFGQTPNPKIATLVKLSKLSVDNLIISLKFLYQFQTNAVVVIDDAKLVTNLIVVSYILANKVYDDQSYTFNTWLSLIHSARLNAIDLKVLKQVEVFFLDVVDYNLCFKYMAQDSKFWLFIQSLGDGGEVFNTYLNRTCNSPRPKQMETPVSSPAVTPLVTPTDSPVKKRKLALTPLYSYNHSYHHSKSTQPVGHTPFSQSGNFGASCVPLVPTFPSFSGQQLEGWPQTSSMIDYF